MESESSPQNRVSTEADLEALASIIGQQNVEAGKKCLRDGGQIWVFQSVDEVEENKEINEDEKEFCRRRFAKGETWAGISRGPVQKRAPIPGFDVMPGYDSHGNSRGRSSGGGNWSH